MIYILFFSFTYKKSRNICNSQKLGLNFAVNL